MKIRAGFVSNSSSSSFCILGYRFEEAEFYRKLKLTDEKKAELFKEAIEDDCVIEYAKKRDLSMSTPDEAFEVLRKYYGTYELFYTLGLDGQIDGECEMVYVGPSWDSIGDDETGKQFKERVFKEVSAIVDVDGKMPVTQEEVIYS